MLTRKSNLQSNHYLSSPALDSGLVFLHELNFYVEETLNSFHFHEPYCTSCPAIDALIPETLTFIPCQSCLLVQVLLKYIVITVPTNALKIKTCHVKQ